MTTVSLHSQTPRKAALAAATLTALFVMSGCATTKDPGATGTIPDAPNNLATLSTSLGGTVVTTGQAVSSLGSMLPAPLSGGVSALGTTVGTLGQTVQAGLGQIGNSNVNFVSTTVDGLSGTVKSLGGVTDALGVPAVSGVTNMVADLLKSTPAVLSPISTPLVGTLNPTLDLVTDTVQGVSTLTGLGDPLAGAFKTVNSSLISPITSLVANVPVLGGPLSSITQSLGNTLQTTGVLFSGNGANGLDVSDPNSINGLVTNTNVALTRIGQATGLTPVTGLVTNVLNAAVPALAGGNPPVQALTQNLAPLLPPILSGITTPLGNALSFIPPLPLR